MSRPVPSVVTGLVSTATDLLRFAALLLDYGRGLGGRELFEDSVRAMAADMTTPAGLEMGRSFLPDGYGWALAWASTAGAK